MVLVLDNAADDDQVVPLLPEPSGHNAVIVTSRRRLVRLGAYRPINRALDVMDDDDAMTLFARIARRPEHDHSPGLCCIGPVRLGWQASRHALHQGPPGGHLALGVRRVPVPAGGDHPGSAVVLAVRVVLPRC
jgi:hypothetical protein